MRKNNSNVIVVMKIKFDSYTGDGFKIIIISHIIAKTINGILFKIVMIISLYGYQNKLLV